MNLSDIAFRVGRHFLAAICSTISIAAILIISYGLLVIVGVIFYGDMGGPLNFILVPLLSFVLGFLMTFVVYLPMSLCFEFWRKHSRLSIWLPPLIAFAVLFLGLLAWFLYFLHSWVPFIAAAALSAFVSNGFAVYWFISSLFDTIISLIRRWSNQRAQPIAISLAPGDGER